MFAEYNIVADIIKAYKTNKLVINIKKSLNSKIVSTELRKAFPRREITDFKF
jgi:hypothetical protein